MRMTTSPCLRATITPAQCWVNDFTTPSRSNTLHWRWWIYPNHEGVRNRLNLNQFMFYCVVTRHGKWTSATLTYSFFIQPIPPSRFVISFEIIWPRTMWERNKFVVKLGMKLTDIFHTCYSSLTLQHSKTWKLTAAFILELYFLWTSMCPTKKFRSEILQFNASDLQNM